MIKDGELLENNIRNELGMKKTRGSGNVKHDADLKDDHNYIVECKYRSKDNIIVEKDWVDTVKKQAILSNRKWIIVNQTKDKEIYITMDLGLFKELYKSSNISKEIS
jgi:hypothetical protein